VCIGEAEEVAGTNKQPRPQRCSLFPDPCFAPLSTFSLVGASLF
jgi:hypothetical protein